MDFKTPSFVVAGATEYEKSEAKRLFIEEAPKLMDSEYYHFWYFQANPGGTIFTVTEPNENGTEPFHRVFAWEEYEMEEFIKAKSLLGRLDFSRITDVLNICNDDVENLLPLLKEMLYED